MLKATMLSTLFAMVLIVLPETSQAYSPRPRVLPRTSTLRVLQRMQATEANQLSRIYGGIADGSLTRYEARTLMSQQRRIRRKIARSLRDGLFVPREIRSIKRMQRYASKRIMRLKMNRSFRSRFSRRRVGRRSFKKKAVRRVVRRSNRRMSPTLHL